jgi:dynactin-5
MTDSTTAANTSVEASPAAPAIVVPDDDDDDDDDNNVTNTDTKETDTASSYIQTSTGNWVSRRAVIENARHVELKGRSIVHADSQFKAADSPTGWIRTGRYCHVGAGTIIQPAVLPPHHRDKHVPVTIGSHTIIRKNCHLQAAAVGSYCWIGCSVVLGPRVIVKDCCVIADNVAIPADTVIPPFTRVTVAATGSSSDKQPTSRLVFRELPPSTAHELQEQSMELYQNFVVLQQQRKLS